MLNNLISNFQLDQAQRILPRLTIGAIVRVDVIIQENDKQRVQSFTGHLTKYHKAGGNTTITLKRILNGYGVIRIFPVHSPDIQAIKLLPKRKRGLKMKFKKNSF